MNAITPIEVAVTSGWSAARADAARWRGQMIEMFAAVELAVAVTLAGISKSQHRLSGQRLEALRGLLGQGNVHEQTGRPVLEALSKMDEFWCLRHFLCHGHGEVLMDAAGDWHLSLAMWMPPENMDQRRKWLIGRCEADLLKKQLGSRSQSVMKRLDNFRSTLPA